MFAPVIKNIKHYSYVFYQVTKNHGLREALIQSSIYYKRRFSKQASDLNRDFRKNPSAIDMALRALPLAPNERPVVMIISDTTIPQCILFRITQKLRLVGELGLQARFFHLKDYDSIHSFMPLCKYIIIYRTAVDPIIIDKMKESGAAVMFEFDDLVVGSLAVAGSGIEKEITAAQAESLNFLSDKFYTVAQRCDALIVSTDFLRKTYEQPSYGLSNKKVFVIPNFIEPHQPVAPASLKYTFAYTSPSGSVRTELGFLVQFLQAYDKTATEDWNILIIGNALAFKHISKQHFRRGTVVSLPFVQYEDYISHIATVRCVLIPLSAHKFNFSKTPIRLMDTVVAGTQAIFSPTGVYGDLAGSLQQTGIVVQADDWAKAGARAADILTRRSENVKTLRAVLEKTYGSDAARKTYDLVFLHEIPAFLAAMPKR